MKRRGLHFGSGIRLGDSILTGDPGDLNIITGSLGRIAPVICEW